MSQNFFFYTSIFVCVQCVSLVSMHIYSCVINKMVKYFYLGEGSKWRGKHAITSEPEFQLNLKATV